MELLHILIVFAGVACARNINSIRGDSNITETILENFPSYGQIQSYLDYVKNKYDNIVEVSKIGLTYEKREISVVKISNNNGKKKPAVFIDAGIHAREWIAPTTALYAIKQLVENQTNHHIFEDIDIYVVPLLNPDGYEYSHNHPDLYDVRMWRKNRSPQNDTDCLGVDLNRNFGYKWAFSGTSSFPCEEHFGGSHSETELETQALKNFLLSQKGSIKVYLTLHSYGQNILYPWGYDRKVPQNEPTLICVAQKAASELGKVRNTLYTVGNSAKTLYAAAGCSDDWAMAEAEIDLAYTIELPPTADSDVLLNILDQQDYNYYVFAPPASDIEPVGLETFEAIKVFARYANREICQSV